MTGDPITPQRTYVLRLVKELLDLETSLRRGRSPFSTGELASRLVLVDRLLTAPLQDLATLGIPTPLPSVATIIRATLSKIAFERGTTE